MFRLQRPTPSCPSTPVCLNGEETAWAYSAAETGVPPGTCFLEEPINLGNWGWSIGKFKDGIGSSFDYPIFAAAGQCTNFGSFVGFLRVGYYPPSELIVTYEMCGAAMLTEAYLWVGDDYLPLANGGPDRYTAARGQFPFSSNTIENNSITFSVGTLPPEFYIAAAAVVVGRDASCDAS